MSKYLNATLYLAVFLFATVTSSTIYANDNVYHFCGAKVDAQNKYYVTKLFPGKLQITATQELRLHLIEKFSLADVAVKCHSYGSDTKPADSELAEKLMKLEIQKSGINAEVVSLDWTAQ